MTSSAVSARAAALAVLPLGLLGRHVPDASRRVGAKVAVFDGAREHDRQRGLGSTDRARRRASPLELRRASPGRRAPPRSRIRIRAIGSGRMCSRKLISYSRRVDFLQAATRCDRGRRQTTSRSTRPRSATTAADGCRLPDPRLALNSRANSNVANICLCSCPRSFHRTTYGHLQRPLPLQPPACRR